MKEASVFTIGIIGHRDLNVENGSLYLQLCCHRILSELNNRYPNIKAISAISMGADSIFAQCATALNLQLESVIPFDKFESDFIVEESYERYKFLRKKSICESRVNFSERSNLAYKKSMEWVVFKSNVVIAAWDGKEIGSTGGTWEAVSLCKILNKTMIHIDAYNQNINLYHNENDEYLYRKNTTPSNLLMYI